MFVNWSGRNEQSL